jgi:type IV pilus assembly protein PilA
MQPNTPKIRTKTGQAFSLVEILVILAVIAVIAAIAIPRLTGGSEAQEAVVVATDADPVASLLEQAAAAGAVDSAGNGPTVEGIAAGTVYTTPDGVVFSMEAVQAVGQ